MTASRLATALALAGSTLLTPGMQTARAGTDIYFGASVRAGDPTDVFLSISSTYFDRSRQNVETWGHSFENPDDLSVFLFLVQRSGKSPDLIASLRKDGNSWFDVGLMIGVPVDSWFLPVTRDPGPPYGNAYGNWKKSKKRGKRSAFVLSDVDTRNLVAVRMFHEYYGVSVDRAMELRASGADVRSLVVAEYHNRHGSGMTGSIPRAHYDKSPDGHKSRKEDRHHQ